MFIAEKLALAMLILSIPSIIATIVSANMQQQYSQTSTSTLVSYHSVLFDNMVLTRFYS
jgi:ABC-type spermidine/putrescine transport system permease subunit II